MALGERVVVQVTWYEYGSGWTVTAERYRGEQRVAAVVFPPNLADYEGLWEQAKAAERDAFPKLFD
jgi:hypothetical protein